MHVIQSSVPMSAEDALAGYNQLILPTRVRFARSRGVQEMTSPSTDARTMAAFLLHFSALSIPMTQPVESWIRRAAERCTSCGLNDLGLALGRHSKAEAGHDVYHREDFESLVLLWNQHWHPAIHSGDIDSHSMTRGGERYCALHEANITGKEPYCQLAIEYQIELLPVELGPPFVQNCVRLFGADILQCMSFVTSHIEFDVGHTKFNAHYLGNLIAENPRWLSPLVVAGSAALEAFGDHLTECWDLGVALAKRS